MMGKGVRLKDRHPILPCPAETHLSEASWSAATGAAAAISTASRGKGLPENPRRGYAGLSVPRRAFPAAEKEPQKERAKTRMNPHGEAARPCATRALSPAPTRPLPGFRARLETRRQKPPLGRLVLSASGRPPAGKGDAGEGIFGSPGVPMGWVGGAQA